MLSEVRHTQGLEVARSKVVEDGPFDRQLGPQNLVYLPVGITQVIHVLRVDCL